MSSDKVHEIHQFSHFKVNDQWYSVYSVLCDQRHYPVPKHFHLKPQCPLSSHPPFLQSCDITPSDWGLGDNSLPAVHADQPMLDISQAQDTTVCGSVSGFFHFELF